MKTTKINSASDISNMSDKDFAKYYAKLVFKDTIHMPTWAALTRAVLTDHVNLDGLSDNKIGDELIDQVFASREDFIKARRVEHFMQIKRFAEKELKSYEQSLQVAKSLARRFGVDTMVAIITSIENKLYSGSLDLDEMIKTESVELIQYNNDVHIYDDAG